MYTQSGHSRPQVTMSSMLGAIDREHRIGVDAQRHVDSDREQHHQVAHARGEVDAVLVHRRGHHELLGRGQAFLQVCPGRDEFDVVAVASRQRELGDGEAAATPSGSSTPETPARPPRFLRSPPRRMRQVLRIAFSVGAPRLSHRGGGLSTSRHVQWRHISPAATRTCRLRSATADSPAAHDCSP